MFRPRGRLPLSIVCVAALIALVVAACSSSNGASPRSTSTADSAASGTPQQGGTVTVQGVQFQSFDPHYSGFAPDISLERMVWRGLYRLNANSQPVPEMAASQPQVSADGKTYTVTLQAGLKWSDGTPLTAKDFVAGIIRTCSPDVAGYYQNFLFNIVGCATFANAAKATPAQKQSLQSQLGVSAPNSTTLVFRLLGPQATFETQLAMWYTFPVPLQVVKNPATDAWPDPTELAFDGPFMVQSYTEKSQIVLVRNPDYHSASSHPAYLAGITEKFIEDPEQADNAFRAGQLDEAMANVSNLKAIRSDASTKNALFVDPVSATTLGIFMQLDSPPLNNQKVRLALSQAVDRKTLVQVVSDGAYTPTTSWIPGALIGISADPFESEIGYNPSKAKANLAAAGYPDGKGFPTISMEIRNTPNDKALAEFLQNAFKTVLNINVGIKAVDSKTIASDYSSKHFQLIPTGTWTQDYPDPEDWVDGQFNTGGSQNFTGCSNQQIDQLLAAAKTNLNNTRRISQYRQINQIISTTICGVAPLWNSPAIYLVNPKLHGMRSHSNGQDLVVAADWAPEDWWLSK